MTMMLALRVHSLFGAVRTAWEKMKNSETRATRTTTTMMREYKWRVKVVVLK